MEKSQFSKYETISILVIYFSVLAWSATFPLDRFTWFLEVFPALIGILIFFITYKRFRFSRFTYWVLLIHAIILMIGGHYTYAKVPFFDSLGYTFGWHRNNFDKLGHFFQGVTPVLVGSQVLSSIVGIKKRFWIYFLSFNISMTISACYELFEWGVAELTKTQADAFLGTQGYIWDTQSDMFFALLGGFFCILILNFLAKKRYPT